jgi:hypothetical protein
MPTTNREPLGLVIEFAAHLNQGPRVTTKRHWRDNKLMRGTEELARLVPEGEIWWRVAYRGAVSQPNLKSDAAKLAEMATRHD